MKYDLLLNLFRLNYRLKYTSSKFGLLWSILSPIITLGIFNIIFIHILKVNITNFPLFLFCGLVCWTFFSSTAVNSCYCYLKNFEIIQKIRFPYHYILFSEIILNFMIFTINFIILTIFSILTSNNFSIYNIFYIIPAIIILILITTTISFITSTLSVFSKDIPHITEIIINIWFYATPIFYSPTMIPEKIRFLFKYNPATLPIEIIRKVFYDKTIIIYNSDIIIHIIIDIIALTAVWIYYNKKRPYFPEFI
ncbi:MAG: ABC transporter permease [Candidatus Muirbacterium halophilum]|nr:ABC transporter permease [Candidatus Muirbacterium halophilum]MCK9474287.1 ABC transporter permease [Candidatus Muirbacterium halophilum]